MNDKTNRACCDWATFEESFVWYIRLWFGCEASKSDMRAAKRDWLAGSTGYEAAHNARHKAVMRAQKSTQIAL